MITKCSNMIDCKINSYNLIDQIPVEYNLIRPIIFLNENCALCNGITNVTFLNFELKVLSENEMNISDYTLSDIIFLYNSGIKIFKIDILYGNYTPCSGNKLDTCNNCKNSKLIDSCKSMQSMITVEHIPFKNIFCALCYSFENPLNFDYFSCDYVKRAGEFLPAAYIYNFLFQVGKRKENIICENNEVFFENEKICRRIIRKTALIELIRPQTCIFKVNITENLNITNVCFDPKLIERLLKELKILFKNQTKCNELKNVEFYLLRNEFFIKEQICNIEIKVNISKKFIKYCTDVRDNLPHHITMNNIKLVVNVVRYLIEDMEKVGELMDGMCPEYIEYDNKLPTLNVNKSIIYENSTYICKDDLKEMDENMEFREKVKKNERNEHYLSIIGLVCLLISELFLLFFLIASQKKKNKFSRANWLQWFLAVSLFLWLLCTIFSPLFRDWKVPCQIVSVSGHFFLLSVILWQSVIAVDMFFNFRSESILPQNWFCTCKIWKIVVSVYSISFILPALGIILHNLHVRGRGKVLYGREDDGNCWIHGFTGQIALIIVPFFTIWSFNCILLGITIFNMNKLIDTSPLKKINKKKEIMIYVKLSVLFGLSWILSLLSSQIAHDVIIFFNIMVNSLQGLWFVIAMYQFKTNKAKTLNTNSSG